MKKLILMCIVLFMVTTAANLKTETDTPRKSSLNFDKDLIEIRELLKEADSRNQKLEFVTSNEKQLKQIKRNIKKNK